MTNEHNILCYAPIKLHLVIDALNSIGSRAQVKGATAWRALLLDFGFVLFSWRCIVKVQCTLDCRCQCWWDRLCTSCTSQKHVLHSIKSERPNCPANWHKSYLLAHSRQVASLNLCLKKMALKEKTSFPPFLKRCVLCRVIAIVYTSGEVIPAIISVEIVQDSPVSERDIGVVLCVFKMTGLPKAASLCSST